ncbi:YczE/YyaS/YitT family protein [Luteipulveratus mongoliensis]|uniref:membrane protein YczE n=1 Tax=Luteipulveratus mongoliensis TaxID=571913 RepID=UPI001FE0D326|nr:hypothetical protein [Luteipulveratus mongoliensis]
MPLRPTSLHSRRDAGLQRLTPREQLSAGRLPRRLTQLMVGLTLYGLAMAMMVRATLGLDPWDVLHIGLVEHTGLSMGTIVIITGFAVLLLWIPLRQWPGLGTVANAIWIGIATDVGLSVLTEPDALWARVLLMTSAIVVNSIGGALYIGSQLGPGPRDGLMTGLHTRTGLSIRLVRTCLELTVLAVGWLMGGVVGVGTVLYAVAIGPLVQLFLPWCVVRLDVPESAGGALVDPLDDAGEHAGVGAREHAVTEVEDMAGC